jgi:hypothetical protein
VRTPSTPAKDRDAPAPLANDNDNDDDNDVMHTTNAATRVNEGDDAVASGADMSPWRIRYPCRVHVDAHTAVSVAHSWGVIV